MPYPHRDGVLPSLEPTVPARARRPRSDRGHGKEIIAEYPSPQAADVRAAMAYGADMARERVIPLRESA